MVTDNFVFHGSGNPPGTSCSILRKPTIMQPFFVADNPRAAQWYASNREINFEGASVFILKLKDEWDYTLFDFSKKDQLVELKKAKLPLTYHFLLTENSMTFFDSAIEAGSLLYELSFGDTINARQQSIKEATRAFHSCLELGLTNADGTPTQTLKDLLNGQDGPMFYRRAWKAKVYEALFKRGHKIFKDGDTTSSNLKGNEYAILDISLIEAGVNKSIDPRDIGNVMQRYFNIDIMKDYR